MDRMEELEQWLTDKYEPIEILELLNLSKEDVLDLIYDWDLWDRVKEVYREEERGTDDDKI